MALGKIEQFNKAIEDKKNILITFKKHFDGDAIGSALALKLFLEQLGKRVDIVCAGFALPSQYIFLKHSQKIKPSFDGLNNFVINIDIAKTGISELSYDTKGDNLRIFITPKNGYINKEDIKTSQSDFKYDLIITIDTPDLNSLGEIYADHENFFYSKPIINIDDHAGFSWTTQEIINIKNKEMYENTFFNDIKAFYAGLGQEGIAQVSKYKIILGIIYLNKQ